MLVTKVMNHSPEQNPSDSRKRIASIGPRLLPCLFGAIEMCWAYVLLIGLVRVHLLASNALPFLIWIPFGCVVSFQWLAQYIQRWNGRIAKLSYGLLILLVVIGTIGLIWGIVYSQVASIFDPGWLLALLNDVIILNPHLLSAFIVAAFPAFFCWRGIYFVQHEDKPRVLSHTLILGIVVLIITIVSGIGSTNTGRPEDAILILLILLFLFLTLGARALTQVDYQSRYHRSGLDVSVVPQERSVLLSVGLFGILLLLVELLAVAASNASFLVSVGNLLGAGYDWLVNAFATVVVFLLIPVSWLFQLLVGGQKTAKTSSPVPSAGCDAKTLKFAKAHHLHMNCGNGVPFHPVGSTSSLLAELIRFALPVVILLIVLYLVRRAVKRRHIFAGLNQDDELHESIWSWSLVWKQVKIFWRTIWQRFFPHKELAYQLALEQVDESPSVRNIREVYRVLLKRAAKCGYPRQKDETPYEYQRRLCDNTPLVDPQLVAITDAYTSTRYGGKIPEEREVAAVKDAWATVEGKWK